MKRNRIALVLLLCSSTFSIFAKTELKTVHVKPLNSTEPFAYTIQEIQQAPLYTIYQLTYPTPIKNGLANQEKVFAQYYLPKASTSATHKMPAVICLHILGGRQSLTKMICSYLAAHGIPAMMPYMPGYGPRNISNWKSKMKQSPDAPLTLVKCIDQGTSEISRAYDILASRPEINPKKISLEGISLGAIFATISGGKDDRFYKLMILLGGGDFSKIIGNSRETYWLKQKIDNLPADKKKQLEQDLKRLDPLCFAPKLIDKAAQNRIMMVSAGNDEVIPPICSKKLAAKMNMTNKAEYLEGLGHYTAIAELPGILGRMTMFITDNQHQQLPEQKVQSGKQTLRQVFIQNILSLIEDNIPENQCRIAEFDLSAMKQKGHIKLIRGHDNNYYFSCDIPALCKGSMGNGAYPWLKSPTGIVFEGTLNPEPTSQPANYINSVSRGYYNMLKGVLLMNSITPQIFDKHVLFSERKTDSGTYILTIQDRKRKSNKLEITFDPTRRIPQYVTFNIQGQQGAVDIKKWNMNAFATDELFLPEEGQETVQVKQKHLDRLVASFINFAGDMIK